MKINLPLLLLLLCTHFTCRAGDTTFFKASHPYFQYTGRIDHSDPKGPRFWQPGVYIQAKFMGNYCNIIIDDEMQYGTSHNYLAIQVDDQPVRRMKTTGKHNVIKIDQLADGAHPTICKNTEAGIGYLQFLGLQCKTLLQSAPKPTRKIEFIGNSITCGTGSDVSVMPCGKGEWYDQHNAYLSYGPLTARQLKAQWQLTSVSGIGLMHSCCNMDITMPQVFDKIDLRNDRFEWDFKQYQPDVVTVCLGQNDGNQDQLTFYLAYVEFIAALRRHYPAATIICLSSPMADNALRAKMQSYLTDIVNAIGIAGDPNVYRYFFTRRYHQGCGDHPSLAEHQLIAAELTAYIRKIKHW